MACEICICVLRAYDWYHKLLRFLGCVLTGVTNTLLNTKRYFKASFYTLKSGVMISLGYK